MAVFSLMHRWLPFSGRKTKSKRTSRLRIFLWCVIPSLLFLVCDDLYQPVELLLQAARNVVRMHDADKNIVVIALDDATSDAYGATDLNRHIVANSLDHLFQLGASRVYFDRFYNSPAPNPADDLAFAASLRRHKGQVFLAEATRNVDRNSHHHVYKPIPLLANAASVVSVDSDNIAGLSMDMLYGVPSKSGEIKTMSASLAHVDGSVTEHFRPDYSIRVRSVPTYSFLDLINDRIPKDALNGKDIIVAPTALVYHDVSLVLEHGVIPGAYFQVLAAQTLKTGRPVDWGRIPSMVIGALLGALHLWSRRRRVRRLAIAGTFTLLYLIPIGLDANHITMDVFPGLVIFTTLMLRGSALRSREEAFDRHEATGLANANALQKGPRTVDQTLIALKLINYTQIVSTFEERVEQSLADAIKHRVTLGTANELIYQADDIYYWFTDLAMDVKLGGHLQGLRALLERTIPIGERHVELNVSFGVDADTDRSISSRMASAALCAEEAERSGLVFKFYDPDRRHNVAEQLELMGALETAIETNQLYVLYQPQYALNSNKMIGVEALVRWNHPTRGEIRPDDFIMLAEKSHRIGRLTTFVLTQAIEAAARLSAYGPFSVAVNISPHLLLEDTLVGEIDALCAQFQVAPRDLTLEITETVELDKSGVALRTLNELHTRGYMISIDDYGTGKATLEYLRVIPGSEVKLDRSFVADIDTNRVNHSLVADTILTIHNLRRRVVAEGVETVDVLNALRRLGCDVVQGYLLGRPMTYAQIESLRQIEQGQSLSTKVNI